MAVTGQTIEFAVGGPIGRSDLAGLCDRVCALFARTAPTVAFRLGSIVDPLAMYMQDSFTLPASLAGIPALSVPCALDDEGMPVGLQICAPAFEEARQEKLPGHGG